MCKTIQLHCVDLALHYTPAVYMQFWLLFVCFFFAVTHITNFGLTGHPQEHNLP